MNYRISTKSSLYTLSLLLLFVCSGCSRPDGELFPALDEPLVWPEPPEEPRIRYVGAISTEKDLKRGVSWAQSFGEFIFGKKDIGVLLNPYAVATDQESRLFVADTMGRAVHVFNLETRAYKQFSDLSEGQALRMPVALAIVGENIYVVDSVLHKICVFDSKGRLKFSFGADRLKRPSGIAYYRKEDEVFVSDTPAHVVHVFDKDGEYKRSIGARSTGPGTFNFPTHLCVDETGRLYVSDTLNYRVQVLSTKGEFIRMFGRHGDRPGYFAHPCGVATDQAGRIYVTDRQFENVQVFDSDGRILMAFGREGSDLGEFWLPGGLFIDRQNRIYVADSFNKRIQIFELLNTEENAK
ncbi:MAG: 6-bladed beta-propeller [Planctomycetota bacterium]